MSSPRTNHRGGEAGGTFYRDVQVDDASFVSSHRSDRLDLEVGPRLRGGYAFRGYAPFLVEAADDERTRAESDGARPDQ